MGYDRITRILHWLMAILVLAMIPAGLVMADTENRALQDTLFIFHKNTGALLLILLVIRVAWRATHPAPPLPGSMPRAQKAAAKISHFALYFLLIVMAVSGYVRVRAGGFPIEMLDAMSVPSFVPRDEALAETAKSIHATAKFTLMFFIVLHVAAATWHGLIRRDGVFSRMWPPAGGRA
ncbi:cytochrome b [Aliihoeflea sp. PC F10.4]